MGWVRQSRTHKNLKERQKLEQVPRWSRKVRGGREKKKNLQAGRRIGFTTDYNGRNGSVKKLFGMVLN